jgi:hypothetical protein
VAKSVVLMDVVMNVMNFLRIRYNIVDCANKKSVYILYIYCRLLQFFDIHVLTQFHSVMILVNPVLGHVMESIV